MQGLDDCFKNGSHFLLRLALDQLKYIRPFFPYISYLFKMILYFNIGAGFSVFRESFDGK